MRYIVIDKKPTDEQLEEIGNAKVLSADTFAGEGYAGHHLVEWDDDKYDKPDWLEGGTDLNIPGHPYRCKNCGELI